MKILITLAWRNLWRKKRRTLITVSSVMFAAVLAIVLTSMLSGIQEKMVEAIVRNSTGYLQVQDAYYYDEPSLDHTLEFGEEVASVLAKFPDRIKYTVPRIHGFCLAAKDMGSRGVMVMGIDPDRENRMNNLSSNIVEGTMFGPDDDYAVVAEGLANLLEVAVGDTVVLLGQGFQGMTAAGKFGVGGIIKYTLPEQNNTMVYLPLQKAQLFFAAPRRLTNLILMVEDESVVPGLAREIQNELDDGWYAVKTWEELLPDQLAAFEAREAQVAVFAWILYIVVGFGIFGTILTMMFERLREFGILLSIGLKRFQLATICFLETLFISFLGVLSGIVVGFPIVYRLYLYPIELRGDVADVYHDYGLEPVMYFSISPDIFFSQGIIIFIIAVIVGLYPVTKAFRLDVIGAARN